MKRITLIIMVLGLVGCSVSKNRYTTRKSGFYTPPNWKKPITVKKRQSSIRNSQDDSVKSLVPKRGIVPSAPGRSNHTRQNFVPGGTEREQMDGYASWYGRDFQGKLTANGERFDQNKMTAAHKILPMNSIVKVTNLENNRFIIVRINDRGPYKKNRILDLTKKAAGVLGFEKQGTTRVSLEVLRYPKDFDRSKGLKPYKQVIVQVGVFTTRGRADRFNTELQKKYHQFSFFVDRSHHGKFSVAVGPFNDRNRAKKVAKVLRSDGVSGFVRSYKK